LRLCRPQSRRVFENYRPQRCRPLTAVRGISTSKYLVFLFSFQSPSIRFSLPLLPRRAIVSPGLFSGRFSPPQAGLPGCTNAICLNRVRHGGIAFAYECSHLIVLCGVEALASNLEVGVHSRRAHEYPNSQKLVLIAGTRDSWSVPPPSACARQS